MSHPVPSPPQEFEVQLLGQGCTFRVAAGETVLAASARHGIAMGSSCRNGACRACIRRIVSGSVSHIVEWPSLLPEEKGRWILPCVARPLTDLVLA